MTNFFDALVMQPELTPREKALRDEFVKQYLLDYDAWAACIRVGFLKSVAGQYAQELMECPYVRQQITARTTAPAAGGETELRLEQAQIKASLMREAHYRGPGSSHAARVAALGKLATLAQMDVDEGEGDKLESLVRVFREMAQKVPV